MVKDELFNSFIEYLSSKDIVLVKDTEKEPISKINNIDESVIDNQLFVMSKFHKKAMGYKGYMDKRLDNKTGSTIEQYKVNARRVKRYLKNIRINSASNDFERLLLKKGNEYVQRAEKCISEIFISGYMDIIQRSMNRTEICLGNADFTNLRKKEKLEVASIYKCCYNNVEMDCFNLLSKYKRKGLKLDWVTLVNKFCEYENLPYNSVRFILLMLSYPYEFIKCCNRYREQRKDWTEEQYEKSLEKSIIKDGDMLL